MVERQKGMAAGRVRLALFEPDIPQNAGTLFRLGACMAVPVDLIEPAGFDASDRAMRRAAMDYLPYAEIMRHLSFTMFDEARRAAGRRLVLATAHDGVPLPAFGFAPGDIVLLGRESAGVPDAVRAAAEAAVTIPLAPGLRSLNVAVAGAMLVGEALRQLDAFPSPSLQPDEPDAAS